MTHSVELRSVSKWYGGVVAVNDITFDIQAGVTGLLGPNGAGKSTLINMISGLLRPSAGTVRVSGEASWQNPGMYRKLGLVPEREALYGFLTAREFVELNARLLGVEDPARATADALGQVDLVEAQDRKLDTYSKGMRQRAKLASALVHNPDILILDEPFNGLDPRQRRHMMDLLRTVAAAGRAVLVSSHILEEVDRISDRVLVIVAGRLAASGPARDIRRLMTDRPHAFVVRSSEDRKLAAVLVAKANVTRLEILPREILVHASDYNDFARLLPSLAKDAGVTVFEMIPADESLESVFNYLVEGKMA